MLGEEGDPFRLKTGITLACFHWWGSLQLPGTRKMLDKKFRLGEIPREAARRRLFGISSPLPCGCLRLKEVWRLRLVLLLYCWAPLCRVRFNGNCALARAWKEAGFVLWKCHFSMAAFSASDDAASLWLPFKGGIEFAGFLFGLFGQMIKEGAMSFRGRCIKLEICVWLLSFSCQCSYFIPLTSEALSCFIRWFKLATLEELRVSLISAIARARRL